MQCPLCHGTKNHFFYQNDIGKYALCENCELIFLTQANRLTLEREKERYLTHENNIEDVRYREYLEKTFLHIKDRVQTSMKGLDFGCGPTLSMSEVLKPQGFQIDAYDPLFFPRELKDKNVYDFVIMSESLEHFYHPDRELNLVDQLLKENGLLLIRTERHKGEEHFKTWYYHRDPTHVIFFNDETFRYVAKLKKWKLEFNSSNVVVFNKGS